MTEVHPARIVPPARARAADEWCALLDAAVRDLGPLPPEWLARWWAELDDVRAAVAALERNPPGLVGLPAGVHALATIATAHAGGSVVAEHVHAAATAVELAYRATLHHAAVLDAVAGAGIDRLRNRGYVLDGDWSITQAAVLVAGIGPLAYRLLVRGYGSVQVAGLCDAASSAPSAPSAPGAGSALLATASALGSLLCAGRVVHAEPARVASWAGAGGPGAVDLR